MSNCVYNNHRKSNRFVHTTEDKQKEFCFSNVRVQMFSIYLKQYCRRVHQSTLLQFVSQDKTDHLRSVVPANGALANWKVIETRSEKLRWRRRSNSSRKGQFCLVLGSVYIGKEECLFTCITNRLNRKGCDPLTARLLICARWEF